jgi:hypothetical protein
MALILPKLLSRRHDIEDRTRLMGSPRAAQKS